MQAFRFNYVPTYKVPEEYQDRQDGTGNRKYLAATSIIPCNDISITYYRIEQVNKGGLISTEIKTSSKQYFAVVVMIDCV